MRRLLLALFLLPACYGAIAQNPQPAAMPHPAGKVELVEGEVTVYDKARKPRRVAIGDTIHEGEGIVTGRDSELHLNMEDGGFIAVRPNTRMSIAAYRAEGDDKDKSILSLLEGTFRSVTGWIGKFNPRSYQVRTPTATIGVRGTDHEPLVIPQGSKEGEPGSYDKVNVGATALQTRHGSIEIRPNQAGFAPLKGQPRPRVLSHVPTFFRATRHEPAIAARHEAIRKVIEQRRDERRKLLQEKKGQFDQRKAERQKDFQQQSQERGRRMQEGGDRRRRLDEGRSRDYDRLQRHAERDHGPRGGGRGRD